jgi:lipopolysaccharide/colanic/teichoic acid biosynthesis glycosyltransferase
MTVVNVDQEKQSQIRDETRLQRYDNVKRFIDLAICIPGLIFLLPIILIFSIAIRLDSPGSPIFIQERVGKGCRRFRMFKFRTMRSDISDDLRQRAFMQAYIAGENPAVEQRSQGKLFKPANNKRITRMGKFLRKTSLDELPQVFNVLKGEMSLIGPRPNIPWEVDKYKEWHYERLQVLPGITGLAQVRGRSSIPFGAIVEYDIEYVRNRSLKLDIQILWLTIKSVLSGKGAG